MKVYRTLENMDKYKKLEKEVTAKVRRAKRSMEKKLAYSKDGNARKFANYIKSKTKARTDIGPLKREDGSLATDSTEMAEMLNGFFATVFTEEDCSRLPDKSRETDNKLDRIQITQKEIRDKIKNLKEFSAHGPDCISSKLLITAREELLLPLQIIYNKSLKTGCVPEDWKRAKITPIYKKGT